MTFATLTPCELHPDPDPTLRPYVVTTKSNAVWFGFCHPDDFKDLRTLHLRGARNAMYWVADRGIGSLSLVGPSPGSKIGDRCDIVLTDVHAWSPCTIRAVSAWETVGWQP